MAAKSNRAPLSPRADFAGWVVRELHLEVTLLTKSGAEPGRGIDARSLDVAERLARIKPLAEGAISLWEMAKQGRFEDPFAGREALEQALTALGPRYAAMLEELPRFEADVDQEPGEDVRRHD